MPFQDFFKIFEKFEMKTITKVNGKVTPMEDIQTTQPTVTKVHQELHHNYSISFSRGFGVESTGRSNRRSTTLFFDLIKKPTRFSCEIEHREFAPTLGFSLRSNNFSGSEKLHLEKSDPKPLFSC